MEEKINYNFSPKYRQAFDEMMFQHTRHLRKLFDKHEAAGTLDEFKKIKIQMREELKERLISLRQKFGIPVDYEETNDGN